MNNRQSYILFGVAAMMAVVLLAMVLTSGTSGGGGGGSPANPDSTLSSETSDENPQAATPVASSSYDVNDEYYNDPAAERDMSIEEFEAELASTSVPVGDNPRDAATSTTVPTATELSREANERGFGEAEVFVDFGLEGNYESPHKIDASTRDRYPSYKLTYLSTQSVLWIVYVNDGNYMAVPMGDGEHGLDKEIVFSESEIIVQYDGTTNQFSDFGLDEIGDGVGIHVTRIDATTLDSYTMDVLEAM